VFWLIILVAIVNLGIGCAVASYLGHGPPGVMEAWEALCAGPVRTSPPPVCEASSPADDLGQFAQLPLSGMLDAEADAPCAVDPSEEAYDEDAEHVARLLGPASPEHWDLDEKYVETSVLKLNIAMIKSGLRANEIDDQLRCVLGSSDNVTVDLCCQRLQEDCEVYLQEQAEDAEHLCKRLAAMDELGSLAREIQAANEKLTAQIETALDNLRNMDPSADPDAAAEKMLEEIGRIRAIRHHVRDQHDAAFLAIAEHEGRLGTIEERLFKDQLTELLNRIGIHSALHDWWRQNRHGSRQISLALYDLDAFTQFNRAHGPFVAERILYHIGKLFREQSGEHDLAGRYAGQQFLLALRDVGPRTATKNMERLRQSIARLTFRHDETSIQLTTSVGITEVKPGDTLEQVIRRLESALKQAKQQGPDRAVNFDGAEYEAIESPNLGAEYTEIAL